MNYIASALDVPELRLNVIKPKPVIFFAKADKATGKLLGVSKTSVDTNEVHSVQIDEHTALQFTSGKRRLRDFVMVKSAEGDYQIEERAVAEARKIERVFNLALQCMTGATELALGIASRPLDYENYLIHYDLEQLMSWPTPVKIYLVDADNPSVLKGIIELGIDTLESIKREKRLSTWPNPIIVNIQDALNIEAFIAHRDVK